MPKNPPLTPLAVGPREAARLMGVSRSRVYELLNSVELPSYKDGRRRLILVADIEARLARLPPAPAPTRAPSEPPTGPLLPPEQQEAAIERATEPEPDLADFYRERRKALASLGDDEARARRRATGGRRQKNPVPTSDPESKPKPKRKPVEPELPAKPMTDDEADRHGQRRPGAHMSCAELLTEARRRGVTLTLDDGDIIADGGDLTPALVEGLRKHKSEIVELLRREKHQVGAWVDSRVADYDFDRCFGCKKLFQLDEKLVVVISRSDARARFHANCRDEWFAEQTAAARKALGLEP